MSVVLPMGIQGKILCEIKPSAATMAEQLIARLASALLELRPRRLHRTETAISFCGNIYYLGWMHWNVLSLVDRGRVRVDCREGLVIVSYRLSFAVWVFSMLLIPALLLVASLSGPPPTTLFLILACLLFIFLIVVWNMVVIARSFRELLLSVIRRESWVEHAV